MIDRAQCYLLGLMNVALPILMSVLVSDITDSKCCVDKAGDTSQYAKCNVDCVFT